MSHDVELFAGLDHHSLAVTDRDADWDGDYNGEGEHLGASPGVVGIIHATRGGGEAPILLEVLAAAPDDDDSNDYDSVEDASIELPSGVLVVTNESKSVVALELAPGTYRVRLFCANADAATYDGGDGADHFRVSLWPGEAMDGVEVLKTASAGGDWVREYAGARSPTELVAWLRDRSLSTRAVSRRCLATVALLRLGDLDSVASAQASEPSRAVRAVFASAVWFATTGAAAVLKSLAGSSDNAIRMRVVESCSHLKTRDARAVLTMLSKDTDKQISELASYQLGRAAKW